jgi:hypothetical protein
MDGGLPRIAHADKSASGTCSPAPPGGVVVNGKGGAAAAGSCFATSIGSLHSLEALLRAVVHNAMIHTSRAVRETPRNQKKPKRSGGKGT